MSENGNSSSRRRPADVLLTLSSQPSTSERTYSTVALDFAVINALGPSRYTTTLEGFGTDAATEYADRKRVWDNTGSRCRDRGVLFGPIVCTAQGAIEPGAAKSLEVIYLAVADNPGQGLPETRAAFAEKLSISLLRSNAQAARRRDPKGPDNASTAAGRHVSRVVVAFAESRLLQAPADGADDAGALGALAEAFSSTSL